QKTALLIALSFGALQSIWITECPCGTLCGHKNACNQAEQAPEDDCCQRHRTASGPTQQESRHNHCFHLEPQTDVVGSPAISEIVPAAEPLLVPPAVEVDARDASRNVPRPPSSRPTR